LGEVFCSQNDPACRSPQKERPVASSGLLRGRSLLNPCNRREKSGKLANRQLGLRKRLLYRPAVGWYDVFMSRDTEAMLDAFEHLPVEEKRAFTQEVLRRSLPFDSGPLEDEEIGAASAALFHCL
jgi:hypothetical protein